MTCIRCAALLFLLSLSACESSPPDDPGANERGIDTAATAADTLGNHEEDGGEAAESSNRVGLPIVDLIDGALERDPATQELPVLGRLNEPGHVTVEPVQNRHQPSQTDTLRTLHYDGADVTVYHVADGKEILQNVTITGEGFDIPGGLRLGMSRSEVENLLGEADQEEAGAAMYEGAGPMPTRQFIHFEDDSVASFEWRFPID